MLPDDDERPNTTSGIRIGLAALTTRGLKEDGAKKVAHIIHNYLSSKVDKENSLKEVKN